MFHKHQHSCGYSSLPGRLSMSSTLSHCLWGDEDHTDTWTAIRDTLQIAGMAVGFSGPVGPKGLGLGYEFGLQVGQTVRMAFEVPCGRGVEPAAPEEDFWIRLKAGLQTTRVSDPPEKLPQNRCSTCHGERSEPSGHRKSDFSRSQPRCLAALRRCPEPERDDIPCLEIVSKGGTPDGRATVRRPTRISPVLPPV
jgi:hypothetical protein